MRTTVNNDIEFRYADEIGYAFMPCLAIVCGNKVSSVEVELDMNGIILTCSASAHKNKAVVDYRDYVQVYFDLDNIKFGDIDYTSCVQRSPLGVNTFVTITAYDSDSERLAVTSFDTFYVWGAIRVGEMWNGIKRLRCFHKYPFSFGVYAAKDTSLMFDDGSKVDLPGGWISDVTTAALPSALSHTAVYNDNGSVMRTTFSNEFDITFRFVGSEQTEILRIEFDDSEGGVYLRWIDRHGFYRYWLFASGNETRAISSDTSYIRNNLDEYSYLYGYYGANGRRQSYAREDTVSLCAPLVDSETFDMLQDLTSSPVVDMYLGNNKWGAVTIKVGSFVKSTAVLQDFECSLVLNDINIQEL